MRGSEYNLELINGNWAISALALAIICAAYLRHEWMARRYYPEPDERFTVGMRMALALIVLAVGSFIRSLVLFEWFHTGTMVETLSNVWMIVGGSIALTGFLMVIRQLSVRIFGQGPWLITLIIMGLFTSVSLSSKFLF